MTGLSVYTPPNVIEELSDLVADGISSVQMPIDEVQNYADLLQNLKNRFHDPNTTKHEQMLILTLIPSSWNFPFVREHFKVTYYIFES